MHVRYVDIDACRQCEGERATHDRRAHPYESPTKHQRVVRLQTRLVLMQVRAYRLGEETSWAILLETDVQGGGDQRLREQIDAILRRNDRPPICNHRIYHHQMAENDTKHPGPLVLGRVVHYRTHGSADHVTYPQTCNAADVTEHDRESGEDDRVGLMVKTPRGVFFKPLSDGGIPYDGSGEPAAETWHWGLLCPYGL